MRITGICVDMVKSGILNRLIIPVAQITLPITTVKGRIIPARLLKVKKRTRITTRITRGIIFCISSAKPDHVADDRSGFV